MPVKLNQHLQDGLLRLAITDDGFIKLVAGRVDPKFLTSRITSTVARLCFDYFEQFGEAPKDHFYDELVREIQDRPEDERQEYAQYVRKLLDMGAPNREYILRRVGDFVKRREREIALVEAADLLEEDKLEEADNVLYAALQSGIPEEDAGLDYLRDLSHVGQYQANDHLMGTGIRALNKLIGGYDRGQLLVTLGGYKGGKTWSLMHLAVAALFRGLSVLHVSMEVSQRIMETRYDMMLSKRGTKRVGETIHVVGFNNKYDAVKKQNYKIRSVYDTGVILKARRRVTRFGGRLRIKKYPMGQCKPAEIIRFLNYLEAHEGFVPDVLIIDYLDIMDLSGFRTELRHQLNDAYIWAKGLADERNILVATVSQVRREALKKRHVSPKDVAEDIRKVGNVDLMLAIGREDDDVKKGVAGLSVIANRDGVQDVFCSFSLCFDIGQFCLRSWIGSEKDQQVKDYTEQKGIESMGDPDGRHDDD